MTPWHATYERCVANGQWQNAAAIRGCSVHQVRAERDTSYADEHKAVVAMPVCEPFRGKPRLSTEVTAGPATEPKRTNPGCTPELAESIRNRMRNLDWKFNDLAKKCGSSSGVMRNVLAPQGHMSDTMRNRILSALEHGEKQLGPA